MCGIAGILNAEPGPLAELETTLRALNRAQRHRGPDDEGVWVSPEGRAGLAHVRLSILDLSPAGHQPMGTPDGRFQITFNGEIYNFRELREELSREGVLFVSDSDTEVLLRLYERQGPEMVGKLRGMFAFCVWDEVEKTAFLARDPMGIKPLYYSMVAGRLVFASELKSLRRSGMVSSDIDPSALVAYFETGSVPEPMTLLASVRCLEAGHTLVWHEGRLQKSRYWRPVFPDGVATEAEAAERMHESLLDSVRAHFVSDVPVGIFLSGGMDSTALLALARECGHERVSTFAIGVDDAALDESGVARETAARFGADHHELQLSGAAAEESFAEFLKCGDQPSIDGFNTFTVARFARRSGMKVVLSGLGGDEIFGGYPSFSTVPRLARLNRLLRLLPGAAPVAGLVLERHGRSPRVRRLGSMLLRPPSMVSAYQAFRGVFSRRVARCLAYRYAGTSTAAMADWQGEAPQAVTEGDQVSELEITRYMRNQLLCDSDVMSMAHGLELRVPMVDSRLFEAAAQIPAATRLRPGKRMLQEAVPDIPVAVAAAPKRGFVFPFEKWLEASWGDEFSRVSSSMPAPNPTWYQRWSVFVLERWLKDG